MVALMEPDPEPEPGYLISDDASHDLDEYLSDEDDASHDLEEYLSDEDDLLPREACV
jgi:hypothetical protein